MHTSLDLFPDKPHRRQREAIEFAFDKKSSILPPPVSH